MGNSTAKTSRRLTTLSLVVSLLLVAGLAAAYHIYNSQLALAQAADSFLDVFTAGVLMWTVTVAAQPEDDEHPFGHNRAEPIGALITAVVAGVLAIEVGRSAIQALTSPQAARMDWPLVGVFAVKSAIKVALFVMAGRALKTSGSPAMHALKVDARNDVAVSVAAIAGFFAVRAGWRSLDAWLALPVAVWIAWSGVELARENLRYLMGEAPPEERQSELRALACGIEGVKDAHDLKAHYLGTEIQVHMHIIVSPDISVKTAHDIGEAVRKRLESEEDVSMCSVHIDID